MAINWWAVTAIFIAGIGGIVSIFNGTPDAFINALQADVLLGIGYLIKTKWN